MQFFRKIHVYLTLSTYVRTEVNYTEEVEDPVDSDGKNLLNCASTFSLEKPKHDCCQNSDRNTVGDHA